jgi:integrin-linked kinase-associated serine/threonine phosphatase 2C
MLPRNDSINSADSIIVLPQNFFETSRQYDEFGYYDTIGHFRANQEDALIRQLINQNNLIPEGKKISLSPKKIADILKNCYRQLDKDFMHQYPDAYDGTTAVTTVYDGHKSLITALVGDAAAFAVCYAENGKIAKLVRLNSITHKPNDPDERARIEACGGFVSQSRVNGSLAISRAIGDGLLKSSGVTAEATTDILRMIVLAKDWSEDSVNSEGFDESVRPFAGKIQIIATCDGFTDGAGRHQQSKKGHEAYLLEALERINPKGQLSEKDLAESLAKAAIADGSTDNVSVAIQTISRKTPAFLLGVYDGHGGSQASTFVANGMGILFQQFCHSGI